MNKVPFFLASFLLSSQGITSSYEDEIKKVMESNFPEKLAIAQNEYNKLQHKPRFGGSPQELGKQAETARIEAMANPTDENIRTYVELHNAFLDKAVPASLDKKNL